MVGLFQDYQKAHKEMSKKTYKYYIEDLNLLAYSSWHN